jgi:hypothetical protein
MSKIEVIVETLHQVVDGHGKLHDDLSAVNQQSQLLGRIEPPMQDPATTAFAGAASQAGQGHLDSAARIERELRTRIEELKASVEQYARTEHVNGGRF